MSENNNKVLRNRNERRFTSVTKRLSSIFPGILKVNRGFNLKQDEAKDSITALPSANSQHDSPNVSINRRHSFIRSRSVILPQFRSSSLYDIFQYSNSSIDLTDYSLNEKEEDIDITNNNINPFKDRRVEEETDLNSLYLRRRLSSVSSSTSTSSLHRHRRSSHRFSLYDTTEEPPDEPVLRQPDRLAPPPERYRHSGTFESRAEVRDLTSPDVARSRQFRSQSLCNLVSIPDAKSVPEAYRDNNQTAIPGLTRHSHSLRGRGGAVNLNMAESYQASQSPGEASGVTQPQSMESSNDQSLKVPGGESSGLDTVDRRQAFSRSQVSSSEFFSVSFVGGDISDSMRTEFVPSGKEMLMAEALCGALQIRSLDNQHIECYIENSSVILPFLCTETSWLGGKHIICLVNPKDGKKGTDKQSRLVKSTSTSSQYSSRKLSKNYKAKGSRFFSHSTEEQSVPLTVGYKYPPVKPLKLRLGEIFGTNKLEASTMENLSKILDSFSRYGVPKVLELTSCDLPEENMYLLESSWRDIVKNHDKMTENDIRLQESMWELVVTENKHIQHLKLMTDLFLASLVHLQTENILVEVDRNLLYSNVAELFDLHRYFWNDLFVNLLHRPRLSGEMMDPDMITSGFVNFHERFVPYVKYCTDQQEHCRQYCKKLMKDELFKAYSVWCETHMENNRLGILDLFIIPLQRLTKYALLLKEIKKYLPVDSMKAIHMDITALNVHVFVESINTSLQLLMDEALLKELSPRIDNYETPDYKKEDEFEKLNRPYASLDLLAPMPGCSPRYLRKILQEGAISIREQWKTKSIDVYAFLFTDMLLICKTSGKKNSERYKVIRQPYCIDRLVMTEVMRENVSVIYITYLDMFNVPVKSFIISSNDKSITTKSWFKNMEKAQMFFQQARILSSNGAVIRHLKEQGLPADLIPSDRIEEEGMFYASQFLPYCNHKQFEGKGEYSSSQCSQLPSLLHSHSGSMEVTEGSSTAHSRGVSIELDIGRGSSLSSDEGSSGAELRLAVTPSQTSSPSPRLDRRSPLRSPNMLAVYSLPHSSGQSLPNLTIPENTSSSPTSPGASSSPLATGSSTLLSVPFNKLSPLSPSHRGVSYPPPSPRALRRSYAVPQSRNPPLQKSRHVLGVRSANEVESFDVPVLPTGISPPKDTNVAATVHRQMSGPAPPVPPRQMSYSDESTGGGKRLVRQDPRRYYTAGVVDDIKKQEARNATLQKRFSLNTPGHAVPVPVAPPVVPPKTGAIPKTLNKAPICYVDIAAGPSTQSERVAIVAQHVPGIVGGYDSALCERASKQYSQAYKPRCSSASFAGDEIVKALHDQLNEITKQAEQQLQEQEEDPMYELFEYKKPVGMFTVNVLDPEIKFRREGSPTSTMPIEGTSGTSDA